MLDSTKAAINKALNGFKTFIYVFNLFIQIVYIGYIVYAICTGAGVLWANLVLLAISVAYAIFYAIVGRQSGKKTARRVTKRIYKYSKLVNRAITLGATIYGIYIAADQVEITTVLFACVTTVGWIVSFITTLVTELLTAKIRAMKRTVADDIKSAKRPLDQLVGILNHKRGE